MLFPIRSDRPLRSMPYVNYALIAINVLLFAATTGQMDRANAYFEKQFEQALWSDASAAQLVPGPHRADDLDDLESFWQLPAVQDALARAERKTRERYWSYNLIFHVRDTRLWQFITSVFMHSGPMHLIGNMIFLWVFGNNVEDRLGKVGYLLFYLTAGVLAGLAHFVTSDAPALGASGAVAGVTGAFLALFPLTRIAFFFFFFIIGFFQVPAIVVVLAYFALDVVLYLDGGGNVAYTAHIGGSLTGFTVGMTLLLTRLLPREPYDLLTMVEHRRRREKFRRIARDGYRPWEGELRDRSDGPPQDPAVLEARQAIARHLGDHDHAAAAARYADLLRDFPGQVLGQRAQTDLANQLMGDGRYLVAAEAYRLLLDTYPSHPEKAHYQLMLGLVYARYLDRPADARPLLEQAAERLEGNEQATARQLLEALG